MSNAKCSCLPALALPCVRYICCSCSTFHFGRFSLGYCNTTQTLQNRENICGKARPQTDLEEGSAAKYCVFCGKKIYHGVLCLTEARMFASLSKLSELHFSTLSSPPPALVIWVPPQIWHSLVAISVGCCCTRIMTDFDAVHRIYGCIKAGPVAMECPLIRRLHSTLSVSLHRYCMENSPSVSDQKASSQPHQAPHERIHGLVAD